MDPSMARLSISLLILLFFQAFLVDSKDVEECNEELLLKPLPDRKVLAHFHFESRAPPPSNFHGHHHHLFPNAIYQLVDICWKNLTKALSRLFCASINSLKTSASYASPSWWFGPNSNKLRYGSLPREAVCTENLTPWLKLLPCRDKDGFSALMHRPSIYRAFYHFHRLHPTTVKSGQDGLDSVILLEQTLTAYNIEG